MRIGHLAQGPPNGRRTCSQQIEGADHVGLDKIIRRRDGSIHMAFRGKVDNRPRMILFEKLCNKLPVADIAFDKYMARVFSQRFQILKVTGVGQFVQVDDNTFACLQPGVNEVGPDESGPSGNYNGRL